MGTPACGVGLFLPDDVVRDIFSRLPDPMDLLHCAGACRQWHRLLGDPAFLAQRASSILGAFSQLVNPLPGLTGPMKRNESLYPPQFERLHARLPAGSRASDLALFFPKDGGLFDYAYPLASRRGLLLLRIKPMPFDSRKLHLAVCHPLVGERSTRLLPPPPLNVDHRGGGDSVIGYALVTAADHDIASNLNQQQGHPAFQVLFTAFGSDKKLRGYLYSSATGRWRAPIDCPKVFGRTMCGPRTGTVAEGGVVHWLYMDDTSYYTLDVGTRDSEHAVSLTKIPVQIGEYTEWPPFPCTVRGKLAFVGKSDIGKLELWTKQEQDGENHDCIAVGGWLSSQLMHEPARNITIFAFLESKCAMLIQIDLQFYAFHIESKELEPLATRKTRGDCTYEKCVMYEMDWPAYVRSSPLWK